MRLSKMMLHPHSENRFYIPCTFELRTYDAMLTNSIHHIQESDMQVMRDKRNIFEVHMAHGGAQRNDTGHNGIIGFNISVDHMANPHPYLQESKSWN